MNRFNKETFSNFLKWIQEIKKEEICNDFLNEESLNVKNMKDQLGFSKNTKPFTKDKNLIYFKEGFDILACYLEDYIDKELDHYLAKF